MIRFHNLGLFVRYLESGLTELEKVIEVKDVSEVTDDFGLRVSVQFVIDSSNLRYEPAAPLGENNPVDPVLKQRKTILTMSLTSRMNLKPHSKKCDKMAVSL